MSEVPLCEQGSVVGVGVDLTKGTVSFFLDGKKVPLSQGSFRGKGVIIGAIL